MRDADGETKKGQGAAMRRQYSCPGRPRMIRAVTEAAGWQPGLKADTSHWR